MRKIIAFFLIAVLLITPIGASEEQLADVYFSCENSQKRIALTFDDGPHYKYTAEILDILDEYGVKATFFVVGQLAERYPELVLRELEEGHEVASHTWSHPNIVTLPEDSIVKELSATEQYLYSLAEYRPKLFRPPEGKCMDSVRKAAGRFDYEVILWTVDTRDWAHTSADQITKTVLDNTASGSIILCHDFIGRESHTPEALRRFIPELIKNGYEFVTVSELIFSD